MACSGELPRRSPEFLRKGRHQRPQDHVPRRWTTLMIYRNASRRRARSSRTKCRRRTACRTRQQPPRDSIRYEGLPQLMLNTALEVERPEEFQMDHGRPAAASDRGADSRATVVATSRTGRSASSIKNDYFGATPPLEEGAGGRRRQCRGDHGRDGRPDGLMVRAASQPTSESVRTVPTTSTTGKATS